MEEIPPRDPLYSSLDASLSEQGLKALKAVGAQKFFTHQARAIEASLHGRNVAIATSTASGKSLCYIIPVIEALARNPSSCALFMFPTKSLAQDQSRALQDICAGVFGQGLPSVQVGDTSRKDLKSISGYKSNVSFF